MVRSISRRIGKGGGGCMWNRIENYITRLIAELHAIVPFHTIAVKSAMKRVHFARFYHSINHS